MKRLYPARESQLKHVEPVIYTLIGGVIFHQNKDFRADSRVIPSRRFFKPPNHVFCLFPHSGKFENLLEGITRESARNSLF